CLEGRTRDEAAQQLGCPLGTLKSRLEHGRNLLRDRLARRGLELSAALGAVTLAPAAAQAVLSAEMVQATLQAGRALAAGKSAAGAVSAKVVALVNGGIKTMTLAKLKIAAVVFLVAGVAGTGILSHRTFAEKAAGLQQAGTAHVPASARTIAGE